MANAPTFSKEPGDLPVDALRRRTRISAKNLPPVTSGKESDFLGQERAQDAVALAAAIRQDGFNLFVATQPGSNDASSVQRFLVGVAAERETSQDWVYVHNFEAAHQPRAIPLPPGRAQQFKRSVRELITDLRAALPAAFDKPDVQARRKALEDEFKAKQEDAFDALGDEATKQGVAIIRTPFGFSLGPLDDGGVMEPDAFNKLPEAQRKARHEKIQAVQKGLEDVLSSLPKWEREMREGLRKLERETAEAAITQSIDETKSGLSDLPAAIDHLDAIRSDLVETVVDFAALSGDPTSIDVRGDSLGPFDRYNINAFVSHDGERGHAPVVEEPHPTLANLVGRVEHRAEDGALTTSFMLIKPGALHRANGGFLILDARSLLRQPMSWEALKRSLRAKSVKIESLGEALSLTTTITLNPSPIPIDVRVVLVGEPWIYHVLAAYDPDFAIHFKLLADFETDVARTEDSERAFAEAIAAYARSAGLRHLDPPAMAHLIEEAAREAGDATKLSLAMNTGRDILVEADLRAGRARRDTIGAEDIAETITQRERRMGRISDRMQESALRDIDLIDTDGATVGQINGLSVFQIGGHRFGKPTRITARARPGAGRVVDIEREARLGGPIHSKGVMILTGYLAGRYALDRPMSLLASLVLEQSYGGVEGDSASLAELCALLSDLGQTPLRQDLGVTGAVNQRGEVQAVGGVNEKIEGFFDLCAARGLSGRQGVLIPLGNREHLMLRERVVEACRNGDFFVRTICHVDDALAVLTGLASSEFHAKVETRLAAFSDAVRGLDRPADAMSQNGAITTDPPPSIPPGAPPEDPPEAPPKSPPSRSGPAQP